MTTFTPRLIEVFNEIAKMYQNGEHITRRTIGRKFGWTCPNAAHEHLARLKALGVLTYEKGQKAGSAGWGTIVPLYSKIVDYRAANAR